MRIESGKAYKLLAPRLLLLVTSVNSAGGVNAAPVSFASPVSFNPAIAMIALAPIRHTYVNIKQSKEFVINIFGREHLDQVLRCAAPYPTGVNKLRQVGLHWYSSEKLHVPRVKEAKAWIECKLLDEKKLGDHIALFGQVVTVEVRDESMTEGEIDLKKIDPVLHIAKNEFAVDFKVIKHRRYD